MSPATPDLTNLVCSRLFLREGGGFIELNIVFVVVFFVGEGDALMGGLAIAD